LEYRYLKRASNQWSSILSGKECEGVHSESRWGIEVEGNVLLGAVQNVDAGLALNELPINVQAYCDIHVDYC